MSDSDECLIKDFAAKHRLNTRTDQDGTTIIPGKNGRSHVYEYSRNELAFMFMPFPVRPKSWGKLRPKLIPPLFKITQSSDTEGCAIFDHTNASARRLVFKVCRIHPRKRYSPDVLAQKRAALAKARLARIEQRAV